MVEVCATNPTGLRLEFLGKKKPLSGFICKDPQIFSLLIVLLLSKFPKVISHITKLTDRQLICCEL